MHPSRKSELCRVPGSRLLRPNLHKVVRNCPRWRHKEVQVLVLLATSTCIQPEKCLQTQSTPSLPHRLLQAWARNPASPWTADCILPLLFGGNGTPMLAAKTGLLTHLCCHVHVTPGRRSVLSLRAPSKLLSIGCLPESTFRPECELRPAILRRSYARHPMLALPHLPLRARERPWQGIKPQVLSSAARGD